MMCCAPGQRVRDVLRLIASTRDLRRMAPGVDLGRESKPISLRAGESMHLGSDVSANCAGAARSPSSEKQ